jgi:hypothetical protein
VKMDADPYRYSVSNSVATPKGYADEAHVNLVNKLSVEVAALREAFVAGAEWAVSDEATFGDDGQSFEDAEAEAVRRYPGGK